MEIWRKKNSTRVLCKQALARGGGRERVRGVRIGAYSGCGAGFKVHKAQTCFGVF
jgi:hypothetical protein